MEQTLLLNATYEPLRVIHWKRAICLVWQNKVEVLEVHDQELRSVSARFKLPAVMRLVKMVKVEVGRHGVKFSRVNIFIRDNYHCQYCGKAFRTEDLTFDHVIPISRGGKKCWENIVTACWRCNNKKSGRTPREAKLKLLRPPKKPSWRPYTALAAGLKNAPEVWRDYLYWNVVLEQDE